MLKMLEFNTEEPHKGCLDALNRRCASALRLGFGSLERPSKVGLLWFSLSRWEIQAGAWATSFCLVGLWIGVKRNLDEGCSASLGGLRVGLRFHLGIGLMERCSFAEADSEFING